MKMLNKLERRIEEIRTSTKYQKYNKEPMRNEKYNNIKKTHLKELTASQLIQNRFVLTCSVLTELEGRVVESSQSKQQKEKDFKK